MNPAIERKLAIIIPSAYLYGGVQIWLDYIVPGLIAKGWQVTIMPVQGRLHDVKKYLQEHPCEFVYPVSNPTGSREGRLKSFVNAIRIIQPDLVLSVNIVDVYGAIARLRRNGVNGVRVAMALHGLNVSFFKDIKIYRNILDGVISTNRLGVAAAITLGAIEENRVYYAQCGVEVNAFPLEMRRDDTLSILYAGRFDQQEKRVQDLPSILQLLDQMKVPFTLKLAGSGPDETELREALSPFGERIEFVGQLDPVGMRTSFYKPGSVLVITSHSESGPFVAWEAMSRGVAIVTSRYLGIGLEGSLRDEVNCLIFEVADTCSAAIAIARLQNQELLGRLVKEGYKLVLRNYSRVISIQAWHQALDEILRRHPQTSMKNTVKTLPAGRLDRFFGIHFAEVLRRLMGIEFIHTDPGGEWPHTYSINDDKTLQDHLHILDKSII